MTPPTVNAYYSGSRNEIVFPAGILQPPFFDKTMDDAVNFGGIGVVIGHELTHGFDDEGRKFDPQGNLRDWWTQEDGKEFEKRASCVANEYSNFIAVDDLKLNGKLTLGENTADNGGARIALMALEQHDRARQDRQSRREDRRLHARAALLPRFRPRLVRETPPGILAHAGDDRPALPGQVSRQRRRCRTCRSSRKPGDAKQGSRWWRKTHVESGERAVASR